MLLSGHLYSSSALLVLGTQALLYSSRGMPSVLAHNQAASPFTIRAVVAKLKLLKACIKR